MDATKYPHPWTQDQALTDRLLKLVDDEDWDLFGIADVGPLNEKAHPGRRPKDLWPTAKAVLMFAVGLADPFTRGWVQNGKSGKFYSYALLELDRRVWTVKRFLRQEGYLYFGGESYGGALFDTGIRFADAAADCGMGYIGKSNVLVTEKYGPRINMTYLMTDAPLVTTIKEGAKSLRTLHGLPKGMLERCHPWRLLLPPAAVRSHHQRETQHGLLQRLRETGLRPLLARVSARKSEVA